jgi:hypothetical protein
MCCLFKSPLQVHNVLKIHRFFKMMIPIKVYDNMLIVVTLALGSWPRQGLARVQAKREAQECGRVWEWTFTLLNALPFWELESQWTLKFSKRDCKRQNPSHWKVLHIIGKLLKRRCLKWARMTHLDIWNTSYGQKKGRESNWQFDSRPLKVGNRPDFLACRWRATCHWKALENDYNFGLEFISIGGLHTKLWSPKVAGVPTLTNSWFPIWSPGTKNHLNVGLMERHKVYYKGEGGGFPQVWAVVNLVSPSLHVAHPSTKSDLVKH